jgi:hypothetical protein
MHRWLLTYSISILIESSEIIKVACPYFLEEEVPPFYCIKVRTSSLGIKGLNEKSHHYHTDTAIENTN